MQSEAGRVGEQTSVTAIYVFFLPPSVGKKGLFSSLPVALILKINSVSGSNKEIILF